MNVSAAGQFHPIFLYFFSKPLERSYGAWGIDKLVKEYYGGLIGSAVTFAILFGLNTMVLGRFEWLVFIGAAILGPINSLAFIIIARFANIQNRSQLDTIAVFFIAIGQIPQFWMAFNFPELGGQYLFMNVNLSIIGNASFTSMNFRYIIPIVIIVMITYLLKTIFWDDLSSADRVYQVVMTVIFTSIGMTSGYIIERSSRVHYLTILQLESHQQELISKNKELEQFAYIASHDLQEPLRSVTSFSQLINEEYRDQIGDEGAQYLDYLTEASNRMRNLIKGLLDYSRLGREAQFGPIDTSEVFKAICIDLSTAISERHAKVTAGPLPKINGFETEFRQLLQNLVSNALKFCKPETVPEVHVSAKLIGQTWEFSVQDNGIGIAPEHHEKIFLIFQRLHNRSVYEGNGIGLANCRKIVEMHGGTLRITSAKDQGSTFIFTIPVK